MPKGWLAPGTGEWIRDHLLKVGEDYPYNIWRSYRDWCVKMSYHHPSYESFRRYIHLLKRLGLLAYVKRERSARARFHRFYYRIVKGREDDPRWRHPYRALYGASSSK